MRSFEADAIKGLCITLMVYGHITLIGTFSDIQGIIVKFIYVFHMPLFLILSGYFFKYHKENKLNNIMRMIGIPYVLFFTLYSFALYMAVKIGFPVNNIPVKDMIDFVTKLFLNPNGAYWFIHALIIIQVVYILIYKIIQSTNTYIILFFSLFIFIFLDQLDIVSFQNSFYFTLGIVLSEVTKNKLIIERKYLLYVILSGVYLFIFFNSNIYEFTIYKVMINLSILSFLWILFENNNNKISILLNYIGNYTLVILVLHALFINLFKILNKYFLFIDPTGVIQSLVVTIGVIFLSILSAKFFDYMKVSKIIFGVDKLWKNPKN